MELTVLTVPGCPNAAALEGRLASVLADYPHAVVRRVEVADEQAAAETGMAGSPTLLINGTDPFAVPGQVPGLSCRLYRDAAGRLAGAPSLEDLRRALEQAGMDAAGASSSQVFPGQR